MSPYPLRKSSVKARENACYAHHDADVLIFFFDKKKGTKSSNYKVCISISLVCLACHLIRSRRLYYFYGSASHIQLSLCPAV